MSIQTSLPIRASIVSVVSLILLCQWGVRCTDRDVLPGLISSIFGGGRGGGGGRSQELGPPDLKNVHALWNGLLLDVVPIVLGHGASNKNGSFGAFKEYALKDTSNDDIAKSTPIEIIKRSGFKYKSFMVKGDDGYITELIRIINPLANRSQLKWPPVVMLHAALTSPATFVWASSIQHHPMRYPPSLSANKLQHQHQHHSVGSWNRSLAFVLANNGYDVWLASARGSHQQVEAHLHPPFLSMMKNAKKSHSKNMTMGQSLLELFESPFHWRFSFDEIIEHELPSQLDKILQVTKAPNVTLIAYSFSTMTVLPFLASRREYARQKVHNMVLMAPMINHQGSNALFSYFYQNVCGLAPDAMGAVIGTGFLLTRPARNLLLRLARSRRTRYGLVKFLVNLFAGFSGQYRTLLEPSVLGHLFEETSFLQVKHFCQQVSAGQLQRYDHGRMKNLFVYGQANPFVYNISNIHVDNWLLLSAGKDNLAPPGSVREIHERVWPKPEQHIEVHGYNHLDLVAAMDNGAYVNLPILDYLNRYHYNRINVQESSRNH